MRTMKILGLTGAALLALGSAQGARGANYYTVDHTGDSADNAPGDGICDSFLPGAECTLRAAVMLKAPGARG